ncbi:MAG: hypothetical protein A2503_11195 [Burkholderiales bacterium RIFOXYD12_FULL_59_19]|nr:MAG: hypothetical protein A2503_11195 [Burkholderiales bacterium RIFOXYD12_FULL_59_19]
MIVSRCLCQFTWFMRNVSRVWCQSYISINHDRWLDRYTVSFSLVVHTHQKPLNADVLIDFIPGPFTDVNMRRFARIAFVEKKRI